MRHKLTSPLIALIGSALMLGGLPLAQAGNTENLLKFTNQERQTTHLAPLVLSEQLAQVAQRHAQDMANNRRSTVHWGEQIKATGYQKPHLGLIVAAGHRTPEEVIRFWMESQSRTYLKDEKFTDVGIGYAHDSSSTYHHYWVMIFGGGQPQARHSESRLELPTGSYAQRAPSLLSSTVIDSHQMKESLLLIANQNRQTTLISSEPLNRVAQRLAHKMVISGLDGRLPEAQIKATGYQKPHLGLIVAAGHRTPEEVLRFWMESQSRTYLKDEKFTDVGIGYAHDSSSTYHHYWVMIFGGGQP